MTFPYSADKEDLYYPARHAVFFPAGRPLSDGALCVEMARLAYCHVDPGFLFDQAKIRKVLGTIKSTDCLFFESSRFPDGRGSHRLLAVDEDTRVAVLAFRGTAKDDPTDIGDDLDAWPEAWRAGGKVHTGFVNALTEILDAIDGALASIAGYKVLFTGHCLGAAMATVATTLRTPTSLYTFGSPRVGDAAFVDLLKAVDNHRYVDCCDLVTRLPPDKILGYAHLGSPFDKNGKVKQRDPADPYIKTDRMQAEEEYLLEEEYILRKSTY
jgi:Lipase (class 3)